MTMNYVGVTLRIVLPNDRVWCNHWASRGSFRARAIARQLLQASRALRNMPPSDRNRMQMNYDQDERDQQ